MLPARHGFCGERPAQAVVISEGGLKGSGVPFPYAPVTFNGVEGTPPPLKCFWEHLALNSHCRFPVQTGCRPPALQDRGLVLMGVSS